MSNERYAFSIESCDIPADVTIRDYRRARLVHDARSDRRRLRWFLGRLSPFRSFQ